MEKNKEAINKATKEYTSNSYLDGMLKEALGVNNFQDRVMSTLKEFVDFSIYLCCACTFCSKRRNTADVVINTVTPILVVVSLYINVITGLI
jgi:hypothetical protein